jgi:hypothetical protein
MQVLSQMPLSDLEYCSPMVAEKHAHWLQAGDKCRVVTRVMMIMILMNSKKESLSWE